MDARKIICRVCGYRNEEMPRRGFYIGDRGIYCSPCYKVEFTGECKECYGKGYSSRMQAIKESGEHKYNKMTIVFCTCRRGNDLENLINQNYTQKI